ncbi:hypothetical protein Scep_028589 [Stephania cephalantha]|uniref:Uncharacterized protein n=1 Tax=Stephania cephalantha TaxID=152367 RepID=A0AAP0EET8_9MAGN
MASVSSLSFASLKQPSELKVSGFGVRCLGSHFDGLKFKSNIVPDSTTTTLRSSSSSSRFVVHCMSTTVALPPTVAETKLAFLKAYKRPIPSVYSTVLQELMVQQHLMRYKRTYRYDAVFGLGFVTVYDQLMEGYQSDTDREAIFRAYIQALKEDPDQYRWRGRGILKDISERAGGKGSFSYSRFFAIGLFRILELANATEPSVLEKLCAVLNISKRSVDRDLDVYRNLLSKLVQAKELLKEYIDRKEEKRGTHGISKGQRNFKMLRRIRTRKQLVPTILDLLLSQSSKDSLLLRIAFHFMFLTCKILVEKIREIQMFLRLGSETLNRTVEIGIRLHVRNRLMCFRIIP